MLRVTVCSPQDATATGLDDSASCRIEVDWLVVKGCDVPALDVVFCRVPATGTVDDVKYEVSDVLWQRAGFNLRPRQFFLELQGRHVHFGMPLSALPVRESFFLRPSPA